MTSRTRLGRKARLPRVAPRGKAGPKAVKSPVSGSKKLRSLPAADSRSGLVVASRKNAGISIKLFSRLTGFSERAIAGWEAGEPVSESARRRLLEVDRFHKRLAEVVKLESIPQWLDTPNEAFDGLKPIEVIERGEVDRLWNMIFYLESGIGT
jgi:DNA-binding transcriptional regulator YiaG